MYFFRLSGLDLLNVLLAAGGMPMPTNPTMPKNKASSPNQSARPRQPAADGLTDHENGYFLVIIRLAVKERVYKKHAPQPAPIIISLGKTSEIIGFSLKQGGRLKNRWHKRT
ncbi:MAG: hypothetical protein ACON3Z_14210 [Bradymonadia bacterium]